PVVPTRSVPRSHLHSSPPRRSSDLTSSPQDLAQLEAIMRETFTDTFASEQSAEDLNAFLDKNYNQPVLKRELADQDSETFFYKVDRKSTRLNSSHVSISYAVFCLKK